MDSDFVHVNLTKGLHLIFADPIAMDFRKINYLGLPSDVFVIFIPIAPLHGKSVKDSIYAISFESLEGVENLIKKIKNARPTERPEN